MKTFVLKLKKIRAELSLTQKKFAEELGLKRENIAQMEIGKSNPTYETLLKIVTVFNVNPTWLLSESEQIFLKKTENEIHCEQCLRLDDIIKSKNQLIETQKKLIDSLERQLKEKNKNSGNAE